MENLPKVYYKIKEISQELNVSESLIRFWEKDLKLSFKSTDGKNRARRYTTKHLEQFKLIKKLLREDGYTLKGVEKVLKKKNTNYAQRLKELKEVKNFLIEVQSILKKLSPNE